MTYFVFCIHNHQPVGNFHGVMEEAYANSYWPFLSALSRHPSLKTSLHTTGFLLDWISENHPEYIELLRAMVKRGQVEIMGGGCYEPVLAVIPEDDREGQIRLMASRIESLFGARPRGLWLAERVWEPTLPACLKAAGVDYVLVDDYHFIKSGLTGEELGGYYVTEDQGHTVRVFPGSERLRYLIPFRPIDELEDHLKGLKGFLKRGNAAIYGDDGEKFGVWPGTGKWVFEEGWLEGFFAMIERNLDWLKPVTMSEYIDECGPVGRVYLPTTSYMEMGEWSLPPEASRDYTSLVDEVKHWKDGARIRRFLQGGTWRNFMSKYPEANWMHKRMLYASRAVKKAARARPGEPGLRDAEALLYKAQCNDAYWHGVFGGLYMPHLRTKIYENLLRAEAMSGTDSSISASCPVVELSDVDADGRDEAVVRTKELNLFFSPSCGGSLVELDFKPNAVNLSNTLSRRYEGYHNRLNAAVSGGAGSGAVSIHDMVKVKEEGLEKHLVYDRSRRVSFVERFLRADESLHAFSSGRHREHGDFHDAPFDVKIDGGSIAFSRIGSVDGKDVEINKMFEASASSFSVSYGVKDLTRGKAIEDCRFSFGVEINLLLPCCDGPACLYEFSPLQNDKEPVGLGSTGEINGLRDVTLIDKIARVRVHISTGRPATLWRHPVYTVSLSEGGFERIYQGTCLLFLYPFSFRDGGLSSDLRVKVEGY